MRLYFITFLNVSISIMDLIAVGIVGIVATLTVRGVKSQGPSDRVNKVLEFLHIENADFREQIIILTLIAVSLFTLKTVFSAFFTKKIFYHIARRGAIISARLTEDLLQKSLLFVERKSVQERLYSLTLGTSVITNGIIGTLTTLISDIALLLILFLGVLYVDPFVAIFTFTIFTVLAYYLYKIMNLKAEKIGRELAAQTVSSSETYLEVLTTYREAKVRQTTNNYIYNIKNQRLDIANLLAESRFMPMLAKYIFEVALVLVTLSVTWLQFNFNESSRAIATLAVFFAASTRISPAILRIQQNTVTIKNNVGSCDPTFNLIDELQKDIEIESISKLDKSSMANVNFKPSIELIDVTFRYPNTKQPALDNINLEVKPGTMVGFVGSSGSGKSTLIDLILGLIPPDKGEVLISGLDPRQSLERWPRKIGYVPQQTVIFNGTIMSNLLLGLNPHEVIEHNLDQALKISGLEEFVRKLPKGLETHVGDRGTKLSGGQKQRLGIARALITDPEILILDEATSSLDAETENIVSSGITRIKGNVTLIVAAHRLSTIMKADTIHYLEDGAILASGTFSSVRKRVKKFDKQAKLMGL